MLETILQYMQWAFPCGLGAALAWLLSGKVRSARTAKEVHDTYKAMYEDVSYELQEMRVENGRFYEALTRLERAVQRATACRLWDECPLRGELPYGEKRGKASVVQHPVRHARSGQHRIRDSGDRGSERGGRQREPVDPDGCDAEPP